MSFAFIISLFTAQHVSNVSISIFRSLRLIVDLFHVLYCSGSMCVGVTVWFGWGGVAPLCRLKNCTLFIYLVNKYIYFFLDFLSPSSFIPPQNIVYFLMLPFLVHKIFTFYINDVLNCKCPAPGSKG